MKILRDLSSAIRFLTIIPLISFPPSNHTNQNDEVLAENFANSMAFFPLVGMLIGILLVLLRRIFYSFVVSSLVGDALVFIVWIWLSGGLHLDGFADSVDGFLGGHDKEEILKIMKDSSTGAKGVVALVSLLLLKFVLLAEMPLLLKDAALFFTPAIGRWSMVIAAFLGKAGFETYELLPYNNGGIAKWTAIGKNFPAGMPMPTTSNKIDQEEEIKGFFKNIFQKERNAYNRSYPYK